MNDLNTKIRPDDMKLSKLMDHIKSGKFAIPRLQREFVWNGFKTAKLFDSIARGLPIGVVLIWETPKSKRLFLRNHYQILPPYDPSNSNVWFIIDGQQRLSVLHCVQKGAVEKNSSRKEINFRDIVLSLDNDKDKPQIRFRKPVHGRFASLTDILSSDWKSTFVNWGTNKIKKIEQIRKAILNYNIYFLFTRMELDEVKESFLRINTAGEKLTTADATFTKAEKLNLRDFSHEVKDYIPNEFSDVAYPPIQWALLSCNSLVKPRGTDIHRMVKKIEKNVERNLREKKSLTKNWNKMILAFGKAADYFSTNFKVLRSDYLSSDYLLAMLALFFFWNNCKGPSSAQKNEIRKWFWATTIGSRYSGKSQSQCISKDWDFFNQLANGRRLNFHFTQLTEKSEIRRAQYSSKSGISAAFYSLLLLKGPVSIMDDGINPIPLSQYASREGRSHRHHIYPRKLCRDLDIRHTRYNSICNVCLLTAEENKRIGNQRPRLYLDEANTNKRIFKSKMTHHLISCAADSGICDRDVKKGFSKFIKIREDKIRKGFEEQAGIRLFRKD